MKTYIKPELEITEVKIQSLLIGVSNTPADKDYEGGGDVKAVDFSSTESTFDF